MRPSARWLVTIAGLALLAGGAIAAGRLALRGRTAAVRADNAAGDTACLSCHGEKGSFEQTAHRLTSRPATRDAIAGSFTQGANVLRTSNPALHFRMDSTATGFFETAVTGRAPDTAMRSERIDFVTGSRKGQSYLYWHAGDQLYQLPVSYWTGVGWVNSPGYPDGTPYFERPIAPRCLECHASGFQAVTADPAVINRYRRTGVMLGITCETCHGAGRDHVGRERSLLHAVLPPAIVNPARLPRPRQLDGCALCHAGVAAPRTPAFSYVPGQPLERRVEWLARSDTGAIDVHGNQVALLERSRCFRSSLMTCATCHDVHRQQRDLVEFSGRCLSCHAAQSCGLFPRHGQSLVGRCVGCHMPALTSKTILSTSRGHDIRVQVRTHWIKVYPQFQLP